MAMTKPDRPPLVQVSAPMADPRGPNTLPGVARLYFGHISTRVILASLIPLLLVRIGLGRWRPWDAGILLITVVAWPFFEWVFHVLSHRPPLRVGRITFDSPPAREHRLHHIDPTIVDHVLLPPSALAVMSAGSIAGCWWLLGTHLGITAAICFHLGGLANGWVHLLAHTRYVPRTRFFQWVRRIHTLHHFKDEGYWFGFTGPFVDVLFGTDLNPDAERLPPAGEAMQEAGPLRRLLLRWVFSRVRWINAVLAESALGLVFLLAPDLTVSVLGIRPSPEAAALFRLYGIGLVSRGLLHRAAFGIPEPRVVLRGLVADIAFALPSAAVLVFAIRHGLAGSATWAAAALLTTEGALELAALAGLYSVTAGELERALGTAGGLSPR